MDEVERKLRGLDLGLQGLDELFGGLRVGDGGPGWSLLVLDLIAHIEDNRSEITGLRLHIGDLEKEGRDVARDFAQTTENLTAEAEDLRNRLKRAEAEVVRLKTVRFRKSRQRAAEALGLIRREAREGIIRSFRGSK